MTPTEHRPTNRSAPRGKQLLILKVAQRSPVIYVCSSSSCEDLHFVNGAAMVVAFLLNSATMSSTPKYLTGDKKAIREFIDKFEVRQLDPA
jgi:hypothetical protein